MPSHQVSQPYLTGRLESEKSERLLAVSIRTHNINGTMVASMKRKLNEEDVPIVDEVIKTSRTSAPQNSGFSALGLESRLLQAIAKENFSSPTQVQAKAIPLALEGKDILARSKTGSGKTAAYVLPILQSLLQKKTVGQA